MLLGPLHNHEFVRAVQSRIQDCDENVWTTKVRLCGLLEACLEELNDVPLYYHMQKDFGIVLKFSLMKQQILRSAIINAGYRQVLLFLSEQTHNCLGYLPLMQPQISSKPMHRSTSSGIFFARTLSPKLTI